MKVIRLFTRKPLNRASISVYLSKKDYQNEETKQYKIDKECGFPFGFGEFIEVSMIKENFDCTDRFFCIDKEPLPIEFLLNCRLDKKFFWV